MHDEEPDHDYGSPACGFVLGPAVAVAGYDGGDDDVAACHSDCADGEDGFAADAVDVENGGNGGDEHDNTDDAGCEEGNCVAGETKALEDGGCVAGGQDVSESSSMGSYTTLSRNTSTSEPCPGRQNSRRETRDMMYSL